MNIQSDFQNIPEIQGTGRTFADTSSAGQNAANLHGASDQANLSAAAVVLSQSAASSDVRTDKIASVKAALANGSYQVSSQDVAAKLIEHMQSDKL